MTSSYQFVADIFSGVRLPVIGVVHALPLPGSPRFSGSMRDVLERAKLDAQGLVAGGVDGLMLENLGDTPYFPSRVPAITVASLATIGTELRREFPVPLGINVLRNDGQSALAIALCIGARFIRVNVLGGARLTDQGIIAGIAHDLLRDRSQFASQPVAIFADVDVKHSVPLGPRSLEEEARELVGRQGADALIVTGRGTGMPTSADHVRSVKLANPTNFVFIGSGLTPNDVERLGGEVDGLIVGSYFKNDGQAENPVSMKRVLALMDKVQKIRQTP